MLNEINLSALPNEEPFTLPASPDGGPVASGDAPASSGDAIQQDLLVAYTDDACRAVGGNGSDSCSQIEANIANAVADMNAAYASSGVNITVNLVGTVQTDYDEGSKSASDMLDELRRTSDGQIDELHTARDDYGADLLALVTGSGGGYCGIAFVGASSSSAMSVTAEFCLSNRTLAHEIGHNQGSSHARSQNGGGVTGRYNYGYRRCDDGSVDDVGAPFFSTIMAYSCSGATRIGGFSNPNINHMGAPTGIDPADDADNAAWAARTLNESASAIAGFRSATTPPPEPPTTPPVLTPEAPSQLVASVENDTVISLTWRDNADNETQFEVFRGVQSNPMTRIASLPANTTVFTDNGANPDTDYRYQVRAGNADGFSEFSNIANASTPARVLSATDLASGEISWKRARIRGSYHDTHADDGNIQRLTETRIGSYFNTGKQRGNHIWIFDVHGGTEVKFSANAYVSGQEGFLFFYKQSTDARWKPMFVVESSNRSNVQEFTFPSGVRGRIMIRAVDAYLADNESADTLSIDYMAITSDSTATQSTPEATPQPTVVVTAAPLAPRHRPTPTRQLRTIYIPGQESRMEE